VGGLEPAAAAGWVLPLGENIVCVGDAMRYAGYCNKVESAEPGEVQMSSGYKSISVTHRSRAGLSLTREVRWYPSNRQAYRWSEQEGRWVYLGQTDSLDEARYLASIDMFNAQRRDN
jgi:hypothetical protein